MGVELLKSSGHAPPTLLLLADGCSLVAAAADAAILVEKAGELAGRQVDNDDELDSAVAVG